MVCLQVKLCDQCLSAFSVYHLGQRALYKYSSFPFPFLNEAVIRPSVRLSVHAQSSKAVRLKLGTHYPCPRVVLITGVQNDASMFAGSVHGP